MIRENDEDSSSDFLKDEDDVDDEKLQEKLVDDIQAYQIDDDSVKELSEIKEENEANSQQFSELQVVAESQVSKSKELDESQSPKKELKSLRSYNPKKRSTYEDRLDDESFINTATNQINNEEFRNDVDIEKFE